MTSPPATFALVSFLCMQETYLLCVMTGLCGSVEGKEENRGKTWPVMEPLMRAQHCLLGRFLTRLKENDSL